MTCHHPIAFLAAVSLLACDSAAKVADAFTVDTSASSTVATTGERGKLVVVLRPARSGWHIDPLAPVKVSFDAPAALRIEKAELSHKDALDPKSAQPRFETAFIATAPGRHKAKATVDLFLCSDNACVREARTLTIDVSVR